MAAGAAFTNTGFSINLLRPEYEPPLPPAWLTPFALAFDSGGNLFVADVGGDAFDCHHLDAVVYKFTPSGVRSTVASENNHVSVIPTGLAIDSADNLFVADWGQRQHS